MTSNAVDNAVKLEIGQRLCLNQWMPKSWSLQIALERQGTVGCELLVALSTGDAALYDYFPFCVWLACQGEPRAILEFTEPNQTRTARIKLPTIYRDIFLQGEVELGAQPTQRGLGNDKRELAIRLRDVSVEPPQPVKESPLLVARKDHMALHGWNNHASEPSKLERSRIKYVGETRPSPEAIFVVGAYRSATSALTWAIGQHPRVFAMEETSWLAPLVVGAEAALRLSGRAGRSALEVYDIDSNEFLGVFGRAVDELCLRISRQRNISILQHSVAHGGGWPSNGITLMRSALSPKDRWVDGTPEYSNFIPLISRMFPAARFLAMVRDPREVARSMVHMNEHAAAGVTVEHAFATWERLTRHVVEGAARLGYGRMRIVPFVTLTERPATTMDAIWEFLDLPSFDPAAVALQGKVNSSFDAETRPDLEAYRSERHEAIFEGLMSGANITSLPWSEELVLDDRHSNHQITNALALVGG